MVSRLSLKGRGEEILYEEPDFVAYVDCTGSNPCRIYPDSLFEHSFPNSPRKISGQKADLILSRILHYFRAKGENFVINEDHK